MVEGRSDHPSLGIARGGCCIRRGNTPRARTTTMTSMTIAMRIVRKNPPASTGSLRRALLFLLLLTLGGLRPHRVGTPSYRWKRIIPADTIGPVRYGRGCRQKRSRASRPFSVCSFRLCSNQGSVSMPSMTCELLTSVHHLYTNAPKSKGVHTSTPSIQTPYLCGICTQANAHVRTAYNEL